MKRITFFLVAVVLAAVIMTGCKGKASSGGKAAYPTPEKPIKLKMGYDPPAKEVTDLTANEFKRMVEEKTNGAVLFELYPANQLGSMKQMMDGVLSGTIEMTLNPWNMLTTVMPEFNAIILPFNIDNIDLYWKVVGGDEFRKKINEVTTRKGIVFLGVPNGVVRGLITTKPVRNPEDLKGLKVRVMDGPIYTDMFNAWGAGTSVISFAECYTALQQGVIESIDNNPEMGVLMKFFEVAKYYTTTTHIIHGCPMFINQEVWNKLSPEQQNIMIQAGKDMEVFSSGAYKINSEYFDELARKDFGVTIIELDAATRQKWIDMSQPVYKKYRGIIGEEFYDWFMDYVNKLR